MGAKVSLLVIDPQNDFCDGPANGALPVPGGWDDLTRLGAMVDRLGRRLDNITVTLDSQHVIDIAHPGWWLDAAGNRPPPFTLIQVDDLEAGRWMARNPAWRKRSLDYARKLDERGKHKLMVWPEHCLIGSPGHAVQPVLFNALTRWEREQFAIVNMVTKGSNPFTEHYSALQAEVPDPQDPSTMLNTGLIDELARSDKVLLAGLALSHCVKTTVEDIAEGIGEENIRKLVFIEDCSSPVIGPPGGPDFPAIGQAFVRDMVKRGMTVTTSTTFLA